VFTQVLKELQYQNGRQKERLLLSINRVGNVFKIHIQWNTEYKRGSSMVMQVQIHDDDSGGGDEK
jgi:hypothetical protein